MDLAGLLHAGASGLEGLGGLFFPPHCAGCRRAGTWEDGICEACVKGAQRIKEPRCFVCSQPFAGAIDGEFACGNCGGRRFHFETAVSAFLRRGVVRDLVHRFKYDGQFHLRHPLARLLDEAMEDSRLSDWEPQVVVPVPLHPTRRRERGFNQAMELARLLSKRRELPLAPALLRVRATKTQTLFDRQGRMENLRNAFHMNKNAHVNGLRVLLVDDVLTTGATLDECARVLRSGGAAAVRAAVVARS